MKNENYGVIWTVEIEIEELEAKIAPAGMLSSTHTTSLDGNPGITR